MILLDDFEQLKRDVEADEKAADRAEGAAAQILTVLKEKYGVKTEEAADAYLAKLKKMELKAARVYAEARGKYDRERESRGRSG